MFSIEVFYYALYANIFKPANIRAIYFYPFGSTDLNDLKIGFRESENFRNVGKFKNHVLFYDQEPLFEQSEHVLKDNWFQSDIAFKLLANSEHSKLKKDLCKKHSYLDWYYFFHGFAALDWYRDFEYLENVELGFDRAFLSLNRLVTRDRSYRLALASEILERNLKDCGHISLHLNDHGYGTWKEEITDPETKIPKEFLYKIDQQLSKLSSSLIVDHENVPGYASADTGSDAIVLYQSALFHVVSETVFYYDKLHLTEKIFKPIVSRRPFLLVAAPGNLAYLKSYGFKTFDRWIDESYDAEPDHAKRIQKIVDQLEFLSKLSLSDLRNLQEEMQETINYNFHHFFGDFKKIITEEMINNLDTCVRIWNNGRVDDRIIDLKHLDNVKKLFIK
jgi:hypothetical protein